MACSFLMIHPSSILDLMLGAFLNILKASPKPLLIYDCVQAAATANWRWTNCLTCPQCCCPSSPCASGPMHIELFYLIRFPPFFHVLPTLDDSVSWTKCPESRASSPLIHAHSRTLIQLTSLAATCPCSMWCSWHRKRTRSERDASCLPHTFNP